jgi:hypothetical protein
MAFSKRRDRQSKSLPSNQRRWKFGADGPFLPRTRVRMLCLGFGLAGNSSACPRAVVRLTSETGDRRGAAGEVAGVAQIRVSRCRLFSSNRCPTFRHTVTFVGKPFVGRITQFPNAESQQSDSNRSGRLA